MLVATSSLGLQNILLRMTMWWGTNLALIAAAVLALAVLWLPKFDTGNARPVAMQVLLITVFVRFAVPVLVIGSNLVFDTFLAAEQTAATQALEATRTEIEELNEEAASAETPADERERATLSAVEEFLARTESYRLTADDAPDSRELSPRTPVSVATLPEVDRGGEQKTSADATRAKSWCFRKTAMETRSAFAMPSTPGRSAGCTACSWRPSWTFASGWNTST